jgi:rhamnulokinase
VTVTVGAVDFGASSIRVCRVTFGASAGPPELEVVHRYAHGPVDDGMHLRWDWARLVAETERGLDRALAAGPLASIGVDTWGVDYGLLDEHGELVEPPISYRDARTDGYEAILDGIGRERFFAITGLQALQLDTVFQLAVHDREQLARARHVMMLPELVVHHLTGAVTGELTSAGTSGLLDVHARSWSDDVAAAIDLPRSLLPPLQPAGAAVGAWRGVPVHLVGGHDTASAVLAGAGPGAPFVSTGTWLIVGREQASPDTSAAARDAGLSNELGACGGVRLLRNVAGWWLVEECRRHWGEPDLDGLLADAAALDDVPVADAFDPRLLAPADMPATLANLAGLPDAAERAAVTRCAVESMAAATARVLRSLPPAPEADPSDAAAPTSLRVFGGGTRAPLLLDALARRTGLRVERGPVEAAALGNALVQAIALERFASVGEAHATLVDEEEQ